jgi:hypothetical protein
VLKQWIVYLLPGRARVRSSGSASFAELQSRFVKLDRPVVCHQLSRLNHQGGKKGGTANVSMPPVRLKIEITSAQRGIWEINL